MNQVQLAVVGGGPAGLSAAIAAARAGVQVALYDENATLGGQLRYRILDGDTPLTPLSRSLIADAIEAGVDLQLNANVWGVFADRVLGIAHPDRSEHLHAEQILLATGSTDRAYAFVGGSLPGVMTARGLQSMLHCARVRPGQRFAVIGTGSEAVEVARDIELSGGRVIVTVDPERDDPSLAAEGDDGVRALTVEGKRYDADIVVIAVGRQPDAELAMMAECACGYAQNLGGIVPVGDDHLRTSVDGIIVAGDAAGVGDLAVVLAEGTFAGMCAAHAIGVLAPDRFDEARAAYLRAIDGFAERGPTLVNVPIHV
jgi:thioredoxin reductase